LQIDRRHIAIAFAWGQELVSELVFHRKKDKMMPQDGFDRLLFHLDKDREQAGRKFEQIRTRLVFYFKKHGCWDGDERADKTINRVARRLAEGETIHNLLAYCFGVARNVLKEHWDETASLKIDDLPQTQEPSIDPRDEERRWDELFVQQQDVECMKECLYALSKEDREMITEYCNAETIANRQGLSNRLGMSLGALRVKVHRIRGKLRVCRQDCLKASRRK
jgi:DNA-directed RNA polymerase specialized sigma24 family protein